MGVARIAVAAATYWIDKPYDYHIPDSMSDEVQVGTRVIVPFSRGNRRCEGIVLALETASDYENLKDIIEVLDATPVLTKGQIDLALWMRERYYCTVYDAFKAILPAGLWFNKKGKRKIADKFETFVQLNISREEALDFCSANRRKAPKQSGVVSTLADFGYLSEKDLLEFTDSTHDTIKQLEKKNIVFIEKKEIFRRPEIFSDATSQIPELSQEQKEVYKGLHDLSVDEAPHVSLLFGVTGSGKTMIYIRLIHDMLSSDRSSILLVPEISLTPQMLDTFSKYFGNNIAVLHSNLSPGERYDEWKRIKTGQAKVVVGTRSAIFAPVNDLGLIVIDEEQEETYKSENNPRYHARDIAKYLCYKSNALLVLGSATPSVESRYAADQGKYSYYELNKRYNSMELPFVEIVDMKQEIRNGNGGNISSFLRDEIQKNIDNDQQTILFLNRRGRNKIVACGECGFVYECPNCSVSLTYHSDKERLICHYCGYTRRLDRRCPECGGILNYIGSGTQKIEEEINELFPDTGILRMDADSVAAAGSHKELLNRFISEKIPIMVGTQMITKGLDIENVTLVGVLSADQSLYVNDYRANERTFSLITQVVGRSGRGKDVGRAVIQTMTPQNETILLSANQDYESFYQSEIKLRKVQKSPPFYDIISITVSGESESDILNCCKYIENIIKFNTKERPDVAIMGTAPMNVLMVNNRYRYRVSFTCHADRKIRRLVSWVLTECNKDKKFNGMSIFADNDPAD